MTWRTGRTTQTQGGVGEERNPSKGPGREEEPAAFIVLRCGVSIWQLTTAGKLS